MMIPKIEARPTALDLYNTTYRRHALDGDVAIAINGKGLIEEAIEYFGGMDGHHAGILFWWRNVLMALEATKDGITTEPFSNWWSRGYGHINIYRLKKEHQKNFNTDDAHAAASELLHLTEYDIQGLGNMFALKVWGIDQTSDDDPVLPERLFCSAFTSRVRRLGGVKEFDKPDHLVAPGDYLRSPVSELVVSLAGRDEPKKDEDIAASGYEVNS